MTSIITDEGLAVFITKGPARFDFMSSAQAKNEWQVTCKYGIAHPDIYSNQTSPIYVKIFGFQILMGKNGPSNDEYIFTGITLDTTHWLKSDFNFDGLLGIHAKYDLTVRLGHARIYPVETFLKKFLFKYDDFQI